MLNFFKHCEDSVLTIKPDSSVTMFFLSYQFFVLLLLLLSKKTIQTFT